MNYIGDYRRLSFTLSKYFNVFVDEYAIQALKHLNWLTSQEKFLERSTSRSKFLLF